MSIRLTLKENQNSDMIAAFLASNNMTICPPTIAKGIETSKKFRRDTAAYRRQWKKDHVLAVE